LVLWNREGKVKDREFRTVQDILRRLTESWNDITFEDVQSVLRARQIRRNWITENSGEYYFESNKKRKFTQSAFSGHLIGKSFEHPV
jgi:hypothetical protein